MKGIITSSLAGTYLLFQSLGMPESHNMVMAHVPHCLKWVSTLPEIYSSLFKTERIFPLLWEESSLKGAVFVLRSLHTLFSANSTFSLWENRLTGSSIRVKFVEQPESVQVWVISMLHSEVDRAHLAHKETNLMSRCTLYTALPLLIYERVMSFHCEASH